MQHSPSEARGSGTVTPDQAGRQLHRAVADRRHGRLVTSSDAQAAQAAAPRPRAMRAGRAGPSAQNRKYRNGLNGSASALASANTNSSDSSQVQRRPPGRRREHAALQPVEPGHARQERDQRRRRHRRDHRRGPNRPATAPGRAGCSIADSIAPAWPSEPARNTSQPATVTSEGHRIGGQARQPVQPAQQEQPLQHQEHAVIGAPGDVGPSRAVPQPAGQEADPQIHVAPPGRHPVAAERDVEVVADPGGQRDVPAPPELRDAAGDVGLLKFSFSRKPNMRARPIAMSE